jgi:hypothetical protein
MVHAVVPGEDLQIKGIVCIMVIGQIHAPIELFFVVSKDKAFPILADGWLKETNTSFHLASTFRRIEAHVQVA